MLPFYIYAHSFTAVSILIPLIGTTPVLSPNLFLAVWYIRYYLVDAVRLVIPFLFFLDSIFELLFRIRLSQESTLICIIIYPFKFLGFL